MARPRLLLAGGLLLVLLAQGGLGLFMLWRAAGAEAAADARLERAVEVLDTLREAQAGFGRQVQEWKNMLLRGADPGELRRFRTGHEAAGAEVQRRLATAAAAGIAPPGRLEAVAAAHARLSASYAAALDGRDLAQPGAQAAADAAVRGADREVAAALDEAAAGFAAQYRALVAEARAEAAARLESMRAALLAASAAAAALVVLLLALLLRAR